MRRIRKNISRRASLAAAAVLLCFGMNYAEAAPVVPPDVQNAINQSDPSRDLNRTIDQLADAQEKKRITDRIGQTPAKVEEEGQAGKKDDKNVNPDKSQANPELTIRLNKVETDPSSVLSEEEIRSAYASYIGKDVTIDDIYKIADNINKLYAERGYITCKAFVKAQTITDGVVHINLIEGKTGEITIVGNKSTDAAYILERLHLYKGKIADTNQLNKDLLRFNATNDAQLRIVMKAGKEVGTTDYTLELYEPKKDQFNILLDNLGKESSGEFRQGIFYTDRSTSGVRDPLTLGLIHSSGMLAYSAAYSRPVNKDGTKFNFSVSGNNVTSEFSQYDTEGQALTFDVGLTHPSLTTDRTRSEFTLDFLAQRSNSDAYINGLRISDVVNDTTWDAMLGFNMTKYGDSSVWLQKYGLTYGHCDKDPNYGISSSEDYWFFRHSQFYQKRINKNGNVYTLKADWQHSFTDALSRNASSRAYIVGGAYTVRGYKENFMSADSGILLSAEYQVPVDEAKRVNLFAFVDYARLYGESGESDDANNYLFSTGLGVKATIDKNINANLTFGFPLKKSFGSPGKYEDVDSMRVTFIVNGSF